MIFSGFYDALRGRQGSEMLDDTDTRQIFFTQSIKVNSHQYIAQFFFFFTRIKTTV